MAKKSALEKALLDTEEILKAVTQNAQDMLYSQMKPNIDLKISEALDFGNKEDKEDSEKEVTDEPAIGDDTTDTIPTDDTETTTDEPAIDAPEETPSADLGSPEGDAIDADPTAEMPMDGDSAIDMPAGPDGAIDLTGATDDEVVSVWKKLGDGAEIQVVKNDDGTVTLNNNGEEFLIKMNETLLKEGFGDDFGDSSSNDDKYSILDTMGGDDDSQTPDGDDNDYIVEVIMQEDDMSPEVNTQQDNSIEEVARTHADGHNMSRKPEGFSKYASSRMRPALRENETAKNDKALITEAEILKTENANLITENVTLKDDLEKHKNALRLMKENLENVALFNSKLAYVNRLFCENATTIEEKSTILERFDQANGEKDVTNLYKVISSEMKQVAKPTIEEKISTAIHSNPSEALVESALPKQSSDPALDRIKEIITYTNNRK